MTIPEIGVWVGIFHCFLSMIEFCTTAWRRHQPRNDDRRGGATLSFSEELDDSEEAECAVLDLDSAARAPLTRKTRGTAATRQVLARSAQHGSSAEE